MSGRVDKAASDGVESQVQLTRRFVAGRGGEAPPPLCTFFYVDALNLYYGALRDSPYRWLDVAAFCAATLRQKPHFNEDNPSSWRPELPFLFQSRQNAFHIAGIKIFTALVSKMEWDPEARNRQINYHNALKAHDSAKLIDICYGTFNINKNWKRDAGNFNLKHRVILPEEKGSDVNLALHMLKDAYENKYECAVMVSNDTDLMAALEMVRARGKLAGVVFPVGGKRNPASDLQKNTDFYIKIHKNNISSVSHQLPETVKNSKGKKLCRPPEWGKPRESEKRSV